MLLEKMSDKRMKISAYSPEFDVPQLFVINGSPIDIANVHLKLDKLIVKLKQNSNRKRPLDEDCRNNDSRYGLKQFCNIAFFSVPSKNAPRKSGNESSSSDKSDSKEGEPLEDNESDESDQNS